MESSPTATHRRLAVFAAAASLIVGVFGAAAPAVAADFPYFACAVGSGHLSSPASTLAIAQGSTAVFTIDIERTGCPEPVTFSAESLPPGMPVTFSENPTTADSITMSFKTSATAPGQTPVGTYGFHINVATGHNPYDVYLGLDLNVTASPNPIATTPTPGLTTGKIGSTTTPVRTSWKGIDPDGVRSFSLQRQTNGGAWHGVKLTSATATGITESLTFNSTYRYRVRATDRLGHTGAFAYGPIFKVRLIQQNSVALTSPWHYTTVRTSAASGGSLKYQRYAGADFTYTFTARGVAWVSVKGPTRANVVDVLMDGLTAKSGMSLYAASTQYRRIVYAKNFSSTARHAMYVRDGGRAGHQRLDIDAFVLLTYL